MVTVDTMLRWSQTPPAPEPCRVGTLWQWDLHEQLYARLVVDMDKETAGTSGGLAALVSLVHCCQHAVHMEKGC